MAPFETRQTGTENSRRMGTRKILLLLIIAVLVLATFLVLSTAKPGTTLSIALYPYVPDPARFQQVIETEWAARHPEVKLNFVPWDGYVEDPPDDLDVFVYDSVYLYDFLDQGCLLPLAEEDIRDSEDYIPCALDSCRVDGVAYALPQLLCTNLLYARAGDSELASVEHVGELCTLIDSSEQAANPSSTDEGLLLAIPDPMTVALWYMEVLTDLEQDFSGWITIPDADGLNPEAVEIVQMLLSTADEPKADALPPDAADESYEALFAAGYGRAFIGYSESMYAMGDAADSVVFHRFSLSDEDDIPMLYADIASINAKIDAKKKPLAVELLNLITAEDVLVAASTPTEENQNPQYLLMARAGIYDDLAEEYPVYRDLKEVVTNPDCRVFVVRPSGREMITQALAAFAD